jgi:thiol-disulfide isomerase/thioredoxin
MAQLFKRMVLLLAGLVLASLLIACTSGEVVPELEGEEGETTVASLLPLPIITGETLDLADYRGQVVLVNFWATWCAPCRIEMPELNSYFQAHTADGFALLAVNVGEPAARAAEYLAEFDYTFTIILDEDGAIDDYFGGVRGMPTSYVLNGEGEVVFQHVGALTQEILEEKVTPLLAAN